MQTELYQDKYNYLIINIIFSHWQYNLSLEELRAQIDAENRANFDRHIDNALPNCAAQILDDLKSLKQGKMAEIIQKFSGEDSPLIVQRRLRLKRSLRYQIIWLVILPNKCSKQR